MANLQKFMTPLRKETLQQVVYDQLCKLILQGGIEPGSSVTVASLADALNVSPMPVREALSRLMAAGALTTVSGRSMGVPKLSNAEFLDIKRVRLETETIALRWAIERRDPAFIKRVGDLFDQLVVAQKSQNNPQFIDLNYQFHFAIYEQSGSPILLGVIQNLWLRISPYFHLLDARGHLHVSNELHAEIRDYIISGDSDNAAEALKNDIERAYDKLMNLAAPS